MTAEQILKVAEMALELADHARQLYTESKDTLSSSDQALVEARLAALQSQNDVDFPRVYGKLDQASKQD